MVNDVIEPRTATTPEPADQSVAISPDRDSATSPRAPPCGLRAYSTFLTCTGLEDNDIAQAAYQVHEDLRLVRKWTQLEVLKRDDGSPMIRGLAPALTDALYAGERRRYVIPVHADVQMSAPQLYALRVAGERCVTLAIVDDDSTTAYYRVFTEWHEIVHPQWKTKSKDDENSEDDASSEDN